MVAGSKEEWRDEESRSTETANSSVLDGLEIPMHMKVRMEMVERETIPLSSTAT